MASTARWGLKRPLLCYPRVGHRRRNGLYSPLGIETVQKIGIFASPLIVGMASTARWGLKRVHVPLLGEGFIDVGMASTARWGLKPCLFVTG